MPTEITVKQGDYLRKIAQEAGFPNCEPIWSASENAQLKEERQNPNILKAGDKLVVPDKQKKEESGATDQRQRFRINAKPLKLRLVVHDIDGKPIANKACRLTIDGILTELTTDGDGKIEQVIKPTAKEGLLEILEEEIQLLIGHLDPVEELSGQQGRLNNLSYAAGAADSEDDMQFRSAVEEFQCDNKLTVDGVCGPNTQAKLKEVHGC